MIAQSRLTTRSMDIDIARPTPLLGGLAPREFMRRHWQKEPLVVRGAVPDAARVASRADVLGLAARDGVESRLVARDGERWSLQHGPLARRALPTAATPGRTVLVQGADLHLEAAHALLARFRFVPDARLDDLMLSWASDGGGVGPHVDSYDVFLLQVRGRRRWRIAPPRRAPRLRDDVPLKMLAAFAPRHEWLLEEGDMLYLPPGWGHDGVAEGETITASIGFRASGRRSLAVEVLQQLVDAADPDPDEPRYADPAQPATACPARIPPALSRYAAAAVASLLREEGARDRALGAALSEPKRGTWFEPGAAGVRGAGVRLDRRTRMLYDARHVYINGEACRAAGRDAALVRRLADRRSLGAAELAAMSRGARALVDEWLAAGWLHPAP
jgi:50S ribosomal protein L16 3-hydroxylase